MSNQPGNQTENLIILFFYSDSITALTAAISLSFLKRDFLADIECKSGQDRAVYWEMAEKMLILWVLILLR